MCEAQLSISELCTVFEFDILAYNIEQYFPIMNIPRQPTILLTRAKVSHVLLLTHFLGELEQQQPVNFIT